MPDFVQTAAGIFVIFLFCVIGFCLLAMLAQPFIALYYAHKEHQKPREIAVLQENTIDTPPLAPSVPRKELT